MRYLLITFFKKPNGQIDEQVGYTKNIQKNHISTCNIIIDFKEKKILKSVVNGNSFETTFDLMCDYYKKIYPEIIDQMLKINT